jgi:plasmid stabilization system protein ParE
MSGFVLHPQAYTDLEEIWEYIASDSIDTADRVLEEIHDSIRSIVSFPHSGHARSDLTARPLRFRAVRDFLIVYAAEEQPLAVVAVLHGRRNPRVIAAILSGRV